MPIKNVLDVLLEENVIALDFERKPLLNILTSGKF
jgi:hypothetical protein